MFGKLYFRDMQIDEDGLWIPESDAGLICHIRKPDGKVRIIDEIKTDNTIYTGIYRVANNILLTNENSKQIVILDAETGKTRKATVSDFPEERKIHFKHDEVFACSESVYIVLRLGEIIKTDINFSSFAFVTNCPNEQGAIHAQLLALDKKIYIPIENKLYTFSMETEEINQEAEISDKIETLCSDGQEIWISTRQGDVLRINGEMYSNALSTATTNIESYIGKISFFRAYMENSVIWYIPCYSCNIACFDINQKKAIRFDIEGEEESEESYHKEGRRNLQKIICCERVKKDLYVMSSKTETLYKISSDTGVITRNPYGMSNVKVIARLTAKNNMYREGHFIPNLSGYLEVIKETERQKERRCDKDFTIGESIWENVLFK